MLEDAQYAFITFGGMARSVKEAIRTLRKEGIRVGAFIPKTVWPFPEKQINKLVSDMDSVFVAEMNLGQMILEVQRASQERNKIHAINKANGEVITPEEIIKSFMEVHNA